MSKNHPKRVFGWIPDIPDFRDFTPEKLDSSFERQKEVSDIITGLRLEESAKMNPSNPVDFRSEFTPIEDQGSLGSCTANAGVALQEYFEKKAHGRYLDASRLFLYKVTRKLLGWTGDTGAYLRTTMGAMVLFGIPPSKYYPYDIARFDEEPPAFCYSFARNYLTIRYLRLDTYGLDREKLIGRIKLFLNLEIPSMFGFSVYSSIYQAEDDGEIPYPCRGERQLGGHAIVAAGYDDKKEITNDYCGKKTTGAFIIRNSWGKDWGEDGYGYLPYDYVRNWLAIDWWTLLSAKWQMIDIFGVQ